MRRTPSFVTSFLALLTLAAAPQALAPASAGAMTDQTTCLNTAIPGVGLVPGMGVAKDSDGKLYVCKLDSAGDIYGGTDKKASTPTPTPTPTSPICGRSCLPLGIGGGAGSGSGSGEVAGPKSGGHPGKGGVPDAYQRMQEENKKAVEKLRRDQLAKMDPSEREIKRLLCQILQRRKRSIDARRPPNYDILASYDRRKSEYEKAKEENRAWGMPEWKPDRIIEAQMPIFRRHLHEDSVVANAMSQADCGLFSEPAGEKP